MIKKQIKELEELTKEIIKNLRYNSENWTMLTEDNGYYTTSSLCGTIDKSFYVSDIGKIYKPYEYVPSDELREKIKMYVKIIKDRDEKELIKLNQNFTAKVDTFKDQLESTYTEEQKAEMLKEERTKKFLGIFRKRK